MRRRCAFSLNSPLGELALCPTEDRTPPKPSDLRLVEQAAFLLRCEIEWNNEEIVRKAFRLDAELSGSLFASLPERSNREERAGSALLERLNAALQDGRIAVELRQVEALGSWREVVPVPPPAPPPREDKTTYFEVRFVDETGQSINGLPVKFALASGPHEVTTNAAGIALLEGVSEFSASVTVTELQSLSDIVEPRWRSPRQAKPLTFPNKVEVMFEGDTFASLPVKAALEHTVVVKPYFKCREVSHFAFGRSFVTRDALKELAEAVQELQRRDDRKALIFGHTDLAGTDAVNKALSERRAKAIHALFVHDAGAWEELCSGSADSDDWQERWGVLEAQHMLNTIGITDGAGAAVPETGVADRSTQQAVARFRTQAGLEAESELGADGRRELFLAYARRVATEPVPSARFARVDGGPWVGCGAFNPLSASARDVESRRAVVFVFAAAAEPKGLPCRLRVLDPCKGNARSADGKKPPYRCGAYQKVATCCSCAGGPDARYDLTLRFSIPQANVEGFEQLFILESEDGTVRREQALHGDSRADEAELAELYFDHLPETLRYRLQSKEGDEATTLLEYGTLPELEARLRSGAPEEEDAENELQNSWLALRDSEIELEKDEDAA